MGDGGIGRPRILGPQGFFSRYGTKNSSAETQSSPSGEPMALSSPNVQAKFITPDHPSNSHASRAGTSRRCQQAQ